MGQKDKDLAETAIFLLEGALANLERANAALTVEETKSHLVDVTEAITVIVACAHETVLAAQPHEVAQSH